MIRKGTVVKLSRKGLKNDPGGKDMFFRVAVLRGRKVFMRSIPLGALWVVTMSEVVRVRSAETLRWARAQRRRRSC